MLLFPFDQRLGQLVRAGRAVAALDSLERIDYLVHLAALDQPRREQVPTFLCEYMVSLPSKNNRAAKMLPPRTL